jgi:hypothetical protein
VHRILTVWRIGGSRNATATGVKGLLETEIVRPVGHRTVKVQPGVKYGVAFSPASFVLRPKKMAEQCHDVRHPHSTPHRSHSWM